MEQDEHEIARNLIAEADNAYEQSLAYGLLQQFESYRHQIEQYASIAHYCPIPVVMVAHDGLSILYVNPAFIKLTGCSVDELSNYRWTKVIHPDDRERVTNIWRKFIADRTNPDLERTTLFLHAKYINVHSNAAYPCYVTIHAIAGNGMVGFIFPEHWEPTDDIFLVAKAKSKVAPSEGFSPST